MFLAAVIVIVICVATPIAALYAVLAVNHLKSRTESLQRRIDILEGTDRRGDEAFDVPTGSGHVPQEERDGTDKTEDTGPLEKEPTTSNFGTDDQEPAPSNADDERPDDAASRQSEPPDRAGFETILATRWMVWLGGATVALAGIFLVKYGIDNAILSPAGRIALGVLMGMALIAGGEWVRRKPLPSSTKRVSTGYIPGALTGAGLVTAFGSVYAGYALYDLFGPLSVFVLLAILSALALGLSLLQGPFIAVLGLIGAFTVPALVEAQAPSAWMLFGYLFAVSATAYAILRYKDWWWLARTSLIGTAAWQTIWISLYWQPGDLVPLGTHLLALSMLAIIVRIEDITQRADSEIHPLLFATLHPWDRFVLAKVCLTAIFTFVLVQADGYGTASPAFALLAITVLLSTAFRFRQFEFAAIVASILSLAVLAGWQGPAPFGEPGSVTASRDILSLIPPLVSTEWPRFTTVAALIGFGFGLTGFLKLLQTRRSLFWVGLSAAMPMAVMLVAYWRLDAGGSPWLWGATALLLAAIFIGAAAVVAARRQHGSGMEKALGVYAVAAVAAIATGWAMMLDHGSLTIALAVLLPAMAWGQHRFGIAWLRQAAAPLAVVVGLRLVLLHHLSAIVLDTVFEPAWIISTFGIPAAAFGLAAFLFRRIADDAFADRLETAAIAAGTATVSMLIRHALGDGTLTGGGYTLVEQSLHSITWLTIGYSLYRRHRMHQRMPAFWMSCVLFTLAATQTVVLQLLASNPLIGGEPIASWLVFNELALAYLVPGAFAALIRQEAVRQGHGIIRVTAGIAAISLVFVYLTMEVRHIFHGPALDIGPITNAEDYAYSLAWIIYAASLLVLGIWRNAKALRYAGMGFILMVVAKVFLWDMASLTGLYRVASFLGLGLSLIGIGYLYQRYVVRPTRPN